MTEDLVQTLSAPAEGLSGHLDFKVKARKEAAHAVSNWLAYDEEADITSAGRRILETFVADKISAFVASEREACALVAEYWPALDDASWEDACEKISSVIRARGDVLSQGDRTASDHDGRPLEPNEKSIADIFDDVAKDIPESAWRDAAENHVIGQLVWFEHEVYFSGIRFDPGEYRLIRVGNERSDPEF